MAEITINDVKFTNVPNKKAGTKFASALTQSNIGVSQSVADYINSAYFYTLVNAVDINWNGIEVAANSYINTTSDLIKFILSVSNNVDLSDYATMSYVNEKISDVIGAAPETLDTLEELAYALSYNASLSYVQEALSGKANANDVYTKTEVDNLIPAPVDLSSYATTSYVTTELDKKADKSQLPNLSDYALKAETFSTKNYTNGDIITSYWNPNSLVQQYYNTGSRKSRQLVFPLYTDKSWLGGGCSGSDSIFALTTSQSKYLSLIYSFVFGENNEAHHNSSNTTPLYSNILIGDNLKSNTHHTTVFGIYNNVGTYDESTISSFNPNDSNHSLFVIGNGKDNSNRHNAFEIKRDGQIWIADTYNGTPYILQNRLNNKADLSYVTSRISEIELTPGPSGQDGNDGADGLSAYQIAVNHGFEGDETAWLASLKGDTGATGTVDYSILSSYVSITSYNALVARVEQLASWIVSYHSSYTPTPSGTDPDIYFMNPTMTVDYTMSASMVDGGASAYPQYLSGSNSGDGAWITWSSSDTTVATVVSGGCITAQGNGTTNISAEYTAHDTYNYKKVEYSLTITNYNSSIEPVDNSFYFMDSNRTLYNSGMDSLYVNNNTGIDTMTYPIQWSSSNANITVDQNGVVSWTMTGETATITATLSDGTNTHTATCTVTTAVNKTSPYGNWYEDGNMITQLTLVEGAIDAHDLTFNGTPSDSWTFSGTLPSGISVDSSTGEIIVSALSSAAAGDYYITGNRMEDSTYWSGMTSFTIKVLPSGTNPQFYYEQQSVNLDNSAMQTQSPMLHNEYAGMGYDVTYSSADTSVATVDAYGMISFAGAGNTTVTATLSNSGNTIATATISVYCTSSTKTVSVISNEFVNASEGLATSEKFKIGYFDYGDTIGEADLSITYTTNSSASISISNVKLKLRSGSKIYASITFDLTVGQGVAANDTVSIYAELTDNGSGCSMANTLVGNIVLVPTA